MDNYLLQKNFGLFSQIMHILYQQTLQPALPRAKAIAFPIPLEAPVTITTGASTFWASSVIGCSIAAIWVLKPVNVINGWTKDTNMFGAKKRKIRL